MPGGLRVLGIDVPEGLVAQWVGWFAPDPQPFLVECSDDLGVDDEVVLWPEVRDTYEVYAVPVGLRLAWLTEDAFGDCLAADAPRWFALRFAMGVAWCRRCRGGSTW